MRKLYLYCLAVSLFVQSAIQAQLPSGITAAFSLNSSAVDLTGNGYDGTLVSTVSTANRFGTINTAMAFTAGTSSGTLPGTLQTALSNDFTIGFWFNTTQTAPSSSQWYGGTALVDAEVCGGTSDWGTALIDGGRVSMGIGNPDITIKSALATYNDGAWHFVTATRDGTAGAIVLYVDGSLAASTTGTSTAARTAPPSIGLGRNPCVATGVYTGSLDDIVTYSRSLSAVEVTNLYNYYTAVALPLTWKSFTGHVDAGIVYLQWETANSVNGDHFEIERSADANSFIKIGVLANQTGIDVNAGSNTYDFTDRHPEKGNDFYRIRQVDLDGKYTLSPILALSPGNVSTSLRIQANPIGREAILINSGQQLVKQMQILDLSGRILVDFAPHSSDAIIKLNTANLRTGFYLLRVNAGGKNTTFQLEKL